MPSLSRTGRPKLSEMRAAWAAVRAAEPDHFEGGALAERDDAGLGLEERVELDIELTFLAMPFR